MQVLSFRIYILYRLRYPWLHTDKKSFQPETPLDPLARKNLRSSSIVLTLSRGRLVVKPGLVFDSFNGEFKRQDFASTHHFYYECQQKGLP